MGNGDGDVLWDNGRRQAGRERCQREWLDATQLAVDVDECAPRFASLLVVADETNKVCAVYIEDGTGRV